MRKPSKKTNKRSGAASARRRATAKGTLYLRNLKSIRYNPKITPTPKFIEFATAKILPMLSMAGCRMKQKQQTAIQCLFQLVQAGLVEHTIADSRNTSTNGFRIKVWDCIIDAKLALKCTGSETSGCDTRYYAALELLTLHSNWPPKMLYSPTEDKGLIFVNDGQFLDEYDQPIGPNDDAADITNIKEWYMRAWGKDNPNCDFDNNSFFDAVENDIEQINDNNMNHTWKAYRTVKGTNGKPRLVGFRPCVEYCQIHSKMPFRAVRLYTPGMIGGQSLTQEQRKTMLIDGQATAELDYKGHQMRLLYHSKRIKCPNDPYKPKAICPNFYSFKNMSAQRKAEVRNLVKYATLIMLNCNSYNQALKAVRTLLNKSSGQREIISKLENSGAKDLIDRIEQAHPQVVDSFYTGIGLELMTSDGKIMFCILKEFTEAGKPVLAIHDSVVVKQEDVAFAEQVMEAIYMQFRPGFAPVISRVF